MEIWKGKPTDLNAYLRDFCDEAEILKLNGMDCNGVLYSVLIWLFVCDAPARAFLKCIKGHQGYHACERRVVVGEYQGRVVFHDVQMLELMGHFLPWSRKSTKIIEVF